MMLPLRHRLTGTCEMIHLSVNLCHLLFYVATAQHTQSRTPHPIQLTRITYNCVLLFNSSIFGKRAFPSTSISRGVQRLASEAVCTGVGAGTWARVYARVCSQMCFTAAAELQQKNFYGTKRSSWLHFLLITPWRGGRGLASTVLV